MNLENFKFIGEINWRVFDRKTGDTVSEGHGKNTVVDLGKFANIASMAGGTQLVLDTIKVGTVDTTFDSSSTALGGEVASRSVEISVVDNVITAEANFLFSETYTIEETGIYSGATPWAFTNSISSNVDISQGISLVWTITHL